MFRNLLVALLALAVAPAGLLAEEIQGLVKSVNTTENTITVTVGNQERTLDVSKDVRVMTLVSVGGGRRRSSGGVALQEISGGLTNVQQGTPVTLTTQTRSGAEVVTQVQIQNVTGNFGGQTRRRR